jgi:uncharacterized protein (DUF1330 family)
MAAYVISELEVLDEAVANDYRAQAAASIQQYGGRYIVRGAVPDVVEGQGTTRRIVIVEFPSMQRLREWYASPAYAKALALRASALERRLMFVEGIVPPA